MIFRAGAIVRNVRTGKPYLVVQAFKAAVLVVDLESPEKLVTPQAILTRNYDQWDEDYNFNQTVTEDAVSFQQYNYA